MPQIDIGENGMLVLTLGEGESICVSGGGPCRTLPLGLEGGIPAALARGGPAEGNGRSATPRLPGCRVPGDDPEITPLSVPEAITEILNAFQQVNVKMRAAREGQGVAALEDPALRIALQAEAMERVVVICQRYLMGRDTPADPEPLPEPEAPPEPA